MTRYKPGGTSKPSKRTTMLLSCVADTPFRQRVIASIFASIVRDHLEIGNLDPDVLKDTRFIQLAVARAINVPAGQAFIEAYKALKKLRRIEDEKRATTEARRRPQRER